MGIRSRARRSTLQILYQIEIGKVSCSGALQDYLNQKDYLNPHKEFAEFLVRGVIDNLSEIDQVIRRHVKNWDISRMAVVDKNILRLGVFELLYTEDIPPRVSINEAVELAKTFGDIDSPKFINGILDSVFRKEAINKKDE